MERAKKNVMNQKTGSRPPAKTPERPFVEAHVLIMFNIVANVVNLFHYVV